MSTLATLDLAGFRLPGRHQRSAKSSLSERTDLIFFTRENKKGEWLKCGNTAVVYGVNGAGKSTIGKTLQQVDQELEFVYQVGGKLEGRSYQPPFENVFVFNDAYVSENLSVSSLVESIILLGEKADLEQKIEQIKSQHESAQASLEKLKVRLADLEKLSDAAKRVWASKLKEDQGWASRESRIQGVSSKNITEHVRTAIEENLAGLSEGFDINESRSAFEKELAIFESTRGKSECQWRPPQLEEKFSQEAVANLLAKTSPAKGDTSVGGITKRIISEQLSVAQLRERSALLSQEEREHCPTCFQVLSPQMVRDTLKAITAEITSMEDDVLAEEARSMKATVYSEIEMPERGVISRDLENKFNDALEAVNAALEAINSSIDEKALNPRVAISVDFEQYNNAQSELESVIGEVELVVSGYNSKVRDSAVVQQELSKANLDMATFETAKEAQVYLDRQKQIEEATDCLEDQKETVSEAKRQLDQLSMQLKNTTEAVPKVNSLLSVVFGEGRLYLEPHSGGYATFSNGSRVEAKDLSTGEKNILALCYFFVAMASGKVYEDSVGAERLIVLDDPISSFDRSNKYGVMALLSLIANQNVKTDSKTRLLVMTHDLEVAYDLSKAFKQIANNSGVDHTDLEYRDGELVPSDFAKVNEYQRLLRRAYGVAFEGRDIEELPSNDLRRLYEAFVTFNLDMTITDASAHALVSTYMTDQGVGGEWFKNTYLSRLFINPGSHSEMNIRITDYKLLSGLSPEDRRRFVVETLVFMHMLAPLHIPSQVSRKGDEQAQVRRIMDSELRRRFSRVQ